VNDTRTRIGWGASFAILAIAISVLSFCPQPRSANEWGDFFAGFGSLAALVWLVLGYLQQQEDLQLAREQMETAQRSRQAHLSLEQERLYRERESEERRLRADLPVWRLTGTVVEVALYNHGRQGVTELCSPELGFSGVVLNPQGGMGLGDARRLPSFSIEFMCANGHRWRSLFVRPADDKMPEWRPPHEHLDI